MCMIFPQQKQQFGPKRSELTANRLRLMSSPAISIRYGEDIPEIKIHSSITINVNYLSSERIANLKRLQKINIMVESFFTPKPSIDPYSNDEWHTIIQMNSPKEANQERIMNSLQSGIPQELRKEVWLYLAETERLQQEYEAKGITYESLKDQACPNEEKIRKDVIRSFCELDFFKTYKKEKLSVVQNILQAYSNLDPEVGYTQGMNFIAGTVFSFLQPNATDNGENNEERAFEIDHKVENDVFWIMVYIMQEKNWRMLYVNHTPKLQQLLTKLDDKLREKMPSVSRVMTENVCLPACFAQYFLTVILFYSDPDLSKRILEIFLLVGEDILIHVLLEALKHHEKKIIGYHEISDLFYFLRNDLLYVSV